MLNDVVHALVKNFMFGFGDFQEHENHRAEKGERDRTEQDDERVAKAVKLRGEDEKNQDDGEPEGGQELVAFDAELARFAGVIDRVTLRQNAWRLRPRGA